MVPWEAPCSHGKRADSKRKQVGLFTNKWSLVDDLRAHVVFGAAEALKQAVIVWPSSLLGEAEIAHFDVRIVVKHKVLELQVQVADPLELHLPERFEELSHAVSYQIFTEK